MERIILTLALFLFTSSLLFIEYGGYKLAFISIILFSILIIRNKNTLIEYSIVFIYITVSVFLYIAVVFKGLDVVWGGYDYYPKLRSYMVYLFATSCFFLLSKRECFLRIFLYSVKIILFLMIIFFALEYVSYIFSGEGLNISNKLLGVEQRALSRNFFRPTLHFAEPGTFVNYTFPLLFIYGYFKGLDNKLAISFSLVLIFTLSIQGIVIGGMYLVFSILSQRSASKLMVAFFIIILGFIFLYGYIDVYIEQRFYRGVSQDASLIKKLYPLDFLSNVENKRLLTGSGLFVDDCHCLIRDVGLAINMFYHYGVFSVLYLSLPFIACSLYLKNNKKTGYIICFIIFVFTSKIAVFSGYYHLLFLMSLFLIFKDKFSGNYNEVSYSFR
ncbi:conserved membrane hypothetical protein [Vibrio chagasii]|nr:conserved membrane hypothetical protein [Vibrio chagasii]CAH6806509.1 conserved membrane hypothetical protein [Vibrio chagasii]CAH6904614.1 conserved membrane hypothetical protein [Vibrio chagasii]CAH6941562.1 conserved membrane hypothetical protein [Vibrio chagasii]CAH6956717.1 conserved membrane hypothetical protein [Vibrio chagasii]